MYLCLLDTPLAKAEKVGSEKSASSKAEKMSPSAKATKVLKDSIPKGTLDAKAGKEASTKGAEKTASEKAASPAKGEKAEKAASEKAAAKSDKASQGKYINVCCVCGGARTHVFEVH